MPTLTNNIVDPRSATTPQIADPRYPGEKQPDIPDDILWSEIASHTSLFDVANSEISADPADEGRIAQIKDATAIAASHDMKPSQVLGDIETVRKQYGETSLWDKVQGSFVAGVGDVYAGVGNALKWADVNDEFASTYSDYGNRLRHSYIPPTLHDSASLWEKITDPEWLSINLTRSVPFTLSLIPAALVGAYGGASAATAFGWGTFGRMAMAGLFGTAVANPMESAFEASMAYEEAVKTRTVNEAKSIANEVFINNTKKAGVDVAQLALSFTPLKIMGKSAEKVLSNRVASTTLKIASVGVSEGAEERYQEMVQMRALGERDVGFFDNDPRLNEATAIGSIFGMALGGTGAVATPVITKLTDRYSDKMPSGLRKIFDVEKQNALDAGAPEDIATLNGLDAVAETEEGRVWIDKVSAELKEAAESTEPPEVMMVGIDEDAEGNIISHTFIDSESGNTFTVSPDATGDQIRQAANIAREEGPLSETDIEIDQSVRYGKEVFDTLADDNFEVFHGQVLEVLGNEEQAGAVSSIVRARADALGVSPGRYVADRGLEVRKSEPGQETDTGVELPQGNKAAVEFVDESKTIIHAFASADVSSMAHEIGHVFRRDMSEQLLATVEDWAGVTEGNWTVEAEEKFARGFEQYLRDGKAPTPELKTVFEQFKQWLTQIYQTIAGSSIDVDISPEARSVYERLLVPSQSKGLNEASAGGLEINNETGFLEFHPVKAALGISTLYQGIEKPVGGRFLRGTASEQNNLQIVADNLSNDIINQYDGVGSIEDAAYQADHIEWLNPVVQDDRKKLRWRANKEGMYGNDKMQFPSYSFPRGRNTWDIPGCGREAWAVSNGIDVTQACYGGACYAERLTQANQGKVASVTTGVKVKPLTDKILREEMNTFFLRNGLDATQKKWPEYQVKENITKGSKNFGKLSIGIVSESLPAAVVTTKLQPAKGADIRLGVDTDGAAWLSESKVMDAILEANPRTLTVYSSAYHKPPSPHALSGRTIINVTVSGWHPLSETLARIKWAEIARSNGWNVILREVVANPEQFTNDTANQYNRLHDALLMTDFFLMQQPLHIGATHGTPMWKMPSCCVGSEKNQHTCDQCEVAEGLGKWFQEYWSIHEEKDSSSEIVMPDSDYEGRMLFQEAEKDDPSILAQADQPTPAPLYDSDLSQSDLVEYEKMAEQADKNTEEYLLSTYEKEDSKYYKQALTKARKIVDEQPVYESQNEAVRQGGLSYEQVAVDYSNNVIGQLLRKRPGLLSKKSNVEPDSFASDNGFESLDDMIQAWLGADAKKDVIVKIAEDIYTEEYSQYIDEARELTFFDDLTASREEAYKDVAQDARVVPKADKRLKQTIRKQTGQVTEPNLVTERAALKAAFKKAEQAARVAYRAGDMEGVTRQKQIMKDSIAKLKTSHQEKIGKIALDKDILRKRRESIKAIRDHLQLSDADLKKVSIKDIRLMSNWEFKQFKDDLKLRAVELADKLQAKNELMNTIHTKRLQLVDNYRKALKLPTIRNMTTDELRQFDSLLQDAEEGDVFLTQREIERVDYTELEGIRTWREARKYLAKDAGVPVEELAKVKVRGWSSFSWDEALSNQDPFFKLLVTKMTGAIVQADLASHEVENKVFELAKAAEKSVKRTAKERAIPQDRMIFDYLEAPAELKEVMSKDMTAEQIEYAHYIQEYFGQALEYLIRTKSLDRGLNDYITHMRRSFLENTSEKGLKGAITTMFENAEEDAIVFNILDDDTGNILPLEKFFQFSMHRTGEMDPTYNVTRVITTYAKMLERKKAFDKIIPTLYIYTQALTPRVYTERGVTMDDSLMKFVKKWVNNKKGRKIGFDSIIKQGGKFDVGLTALRTYTTMLDLGANVITGSASLMGEQSANFVSLGTKDQAKGTRRMLTKKGKAILKKYEGYVGRSTWEEFTAPGKEVTERLMTGMFALFHISTVAANKQFLLGSLTKQEYDSGEISIERLTELRLANARWRVVPGMSSLVGSTSLGKSQIQYKSWAVSMMKTTLEDFYKVSKGVLNKEKGVFSSREARELYRIIGLSSTAIIVGSMVVDADDDSWLGKLRRKLYRESLSILQSISPLFWLASPRGMSWLIQFFTVMKQLITLEEYKTKKGLKGVEGLKKTFLPYPVRELLKEDKK